jgi:hypothetical protein
MIRSPPIFPNFCNEQPVISTVVRSSEGGVVVAGLKAVCPLSSRILVINVRNMWEVSMEGSHI